MIYSLFYGAMYEGNRIVAATTDFNVAQDWANQSLEDRSCDWFGYLESFDFDSLSAVKFEQSQDNDSTLKLTRQYIPE